MAPRKQVPPNWPPGWPVWVGSCDTDVFDAWVWCPPGWLYNQFISPGCCAPQHAYVPPSDQKKQPPEIGDNPAIPNPRPSGAPYKYVPPPPTSPPIDWGGPSDWDRELQREGEISSIFGKLSIVLLCFMLLLLWNYRRVQQQKDNDGRGARVYCTAIAGVQGMVSHHVLWVRNMKYEIRLIEGREVPQDGTYSTIGHGTGRVADAWLNSEHKVYRMEASSVDKEFSARKPIGKHVELPWPLSVILPAYNKSKYQHKLAGWTKKSDSEILRVCQQLQLQYSKYNLITNNCQHFVDRAANTVVDIPALYSPYWYTTGSGLQVPAILATLRSDVLWIPVDLVAVFITAVLSFASVLAWKAWLAVSRPLYALLRRKITSPSEAEDHEDATASPLHDNSPLGPENLIEDLPESPASSGTASQLNQYLDPDNILPGPGNLAPALERQTHHDHPEGQTQSLPNVTAHSEPPANFQKKDWLFPDPLESCFRPWCVVSTLLPCVTYGRITYRSHHPEDPKLRHFRFYWNGACFQDGLALLWGFCFGHSCILCLTRERLRKRLKIRGSRLEDFLVSCFCCWCVLAQHEVEVMDSSNEARLTGKYFELGDQIRPRSSSMAYRRQVENYDDEYDDHHNEHHYDNNDADDAHEDTRQEYYSDETTVTMLEASPSLFANETQTTETSRRRNWRTTAARILFPLICIGVDTIIHGATWHGNAKPVTCMRIRHIAVAIEALLVYGVYWQRQRKLLKDEIRDVILKLGFLAGLFVFIILYNRGLAWFSAIF